MTDLNDLTPKPGNYYLASAGRINDKGQIAAAVYFTNGQHSSVILTPLPEPSCIFALLTGCGLLALRLRR